MALIILEGSDRAGKSTVADAVCHRLRELYVGDQVELWHAGPPKIHPLDEYERPLFTYRPMQQCHIVCDRWHIGESIYPVILNRPTQFTQPVRAHTEAFLQSRGALLVRVHAYPAVIAQRLDAEERECPGKSLVNQEQLLSIHAQFFTETRRSILHYVEVDTSGATSADVTDAARLIVQLASAAERDAYPLTEFRTYVGDAHPNILLVGDVRHAHRHVYTTANKLKCAQLDPTPAFMPYPATSGEYLLRTIEPLLQYNDIGFINANDVDDAHFAWKTLGEPQVVSMGRRAYNTVKTWACGAVPHPQYIRRFYNSHNSWYSLLIQRATNGVNLLGERPEQQLLNLSDDDHEEM